MPLVQRPDQRLIPTAPGTVPGSRSGAAETAATLQQTGIPPIVPGLQTATALRQAAGFTSFLTFPAAGRIWGVLLSYAGSTLSTYPPASTSAGVTQLISTIITASGLTLAVVELALPGPLLIDSGESPGLVFGLEVPSGDTVTLNVNNGTVTTGVIMRGSAVVFYTVP